MEIKTLEQKTPFNISEWNETEKAYIKTPNGFDLLAVRDLFLTFYDKEQDAETRFDAGFRAACMLLVKDDGSYLLNVEDKDVMRKASFLPYLRMFAFINDVIADSLTDGLKKS